MKFGERLKQRRLELKISADELAKRIGKNRATIYRYEKGDIENVPIDVLDPLSEALDTTPEYLLGWSDSAHLGTRIREGEKETLYVGMSAVNVRHFENWHKAFGLEPFTDEEHEKLIEYGKFLISLRDKEK